MIDPAVVEQHDTNFVITLVVATLFFAIDLAAKERRAAVFAIGGSKTALCLAFVLNLY